MDQAFMKKICLLSVVVFLATILSVSFKKTDHKDLYLSSYMSKLGQFREEESELLEVIDKSDILSAEGIDKIRAQINEARNGLKAMDFWFRYLEPTAYKKINGPLPVEWETEVFEKFEKPYKREGAGLTLAALYIEEENFGKDSLVKLVRLSIQATEIFAGTHAPDAGGQVGDIVQPGAARGLG